jgi:hypothetical protein
MTPMKLLTYCTDIMNLLTYYTDINEFGLTEQFRGDSLLFSIYRNNPHPVDKLQGTNTAVVDNVSEETLVGLMENFNRRLQMVLGAHGPNTEHVFSSIIHSYFSRVL